MLNAQLVKVENAGVNVLALEGDFTLDEKPRVEALRLQAMEGGHAGLVLDLNGLRFIDSAGLMVILATFGELRAADIPFAVVAASRSYAEAKLREIGLMSVPGFKVFATAEEATQAIMSMLP